MYKTALKYQGIIRSRKPKKDRRHKKEKKKKEKKKERNIDNKRL